MTKKDLFFNKKEQIKASLYSCLELQLHILPYIIIFQNKLKSAMRWFISLQFTYVAMEKKTSIFAATYPIFLQSLKTL